MSNEKENDLLPKAPAKLAPRGIQSFTVFRTEDETGVSGEGIVIEGVRLATGQCIIHWLYPPPKGGIAIFDSMDDFIKVHILPHLANRTIITFDDGEQMKFGNFEDEDNKDSDESPVKDPVDKPQPHTIDNTKE
tara:strand:- start:608 stop:1009 length:402 start_codon:yes stop_codon:yes gene_type:complete